MRWWLIMFRASRLSLLALGGGLLLSVVIGRLSDLSPQASDLASWAVIAGTAASLLFWLLAWLSLRTWERGERCCDRCGGPLEWWVHTGRVYYGKQLPDFRYCYNCGRATPEL